MGTPNQEDVFGNDLLTTAKEGFIVGSRGGALLRYLTNTHLITIARTGGGKGRSTVIPNLLDHKGSVFCIEIEGEALRASSHYRSKILGQNLYVVDPFHSTDGYYRESINILDTIDTSSPSFTFDVSMLCNSILRTASGKESPDPYWTQSSSELLKALVIYVKTNPFIPDGERNFSTINSILAGFGTSQWEEHMIRLAGDTSKYCETLQSVGRYYYSESGPVYSENTRGILSNLTSYLAFARDAQLQEYSRTSSFNLSELASNNCTIYIVMHDVNQFREYSTWLRLIVERAISLCPSKYQDKHTLSHDERILFLLDEFTQLGRLDSIDTGMQTCRHKGITLWPIFQDVSRLRQTYGQETCESFLGAASCIQAFEIAERETTQYVSDRAGKEVVYIESPSISKSSTTGITTTSGSNESSTYGTANAFRTGESKSTGSNHGTSTGYSGSHPSSSYTSSYSSGVTQSLDITDTYSSSDTYGSSSSQSRNTSQTEQYTLQFTPHIIPSLDPAEVTRRVSNGVHQLVILQDGRVLLEQRAYWDQVELLKERVYGPTLPQNPTFKLHPPEAPELLGPSETYKNSSLNHILNKPFNIDLSIPTVPSLEIESYTIDFVGEDRKKYKLNLYELSQHYNSLPSRSSLDKYRDKIKAHAKKLAELVKAQSFHILENYIDTALSSLLSKSQDLVNHIDELNNQLKLELQLICNELDNLRAFYGDIHDYESSVRLFEESYYRLLSDFEIYKEHLMSYNLAMRYWPRLVLPSKPSIETVIQNSQQIERLSCKSKSTSSLINASLLPAIEKMIDNIEKDIENTKNSIQGAHQNAFSQQKHNYVSGYSSPNRQSQYYKEKLSTCLDFRVADELMTFRRNVDMNKSELIDNFNINLKRRNSLIDAGRQIIAIRECMIECRALLARSCGDVSMIKANICHRVLSIASESREWNLWTSFDSPCG